METIPEDEELVSVSSTPHLSSFTQTRANVPSSSSSYSPSPAIAMRRASTPKLPTLPAGPFEMIHTLHSSSSSSISRASFNNKTYIIKSKIKVLGNQVQLQSLFHEFMIGSLINNPFIVKYFDIKRFGYGFALIMEDIGGTSLKKTLPPNGMSISQFFPIAIKIVKGLSAIHAAGVIHKDINPSNIILNTQTNALNIIDFGCSTQLIQNEAAASAPKYLQGTLLYMAPEQTGRMNRHVDFRADLYSLGATFYEMLSGHPPFKASIDPVEVIFKHMMISPKPLSIVKPGPPILSSITDNNNNNNNNNNENNERENENENEKEGEVLEGGVGGVGKALSDVVDKLLKKNAEDRYQDCFSLLSDLEEIYRGLSDGQTMEEYEVGFNDQVLKFQISQKMYGRGEQEQILVQNYNYISVGSVPVMLMLVHGYSGVGKTTLITAVHKPLVRDKGYFIYGKFNQFVGDAPFSAFIQALQQLIHIILTESEEGVARWKKRILDGLGDKGQLIIDVLPDLEIIIGPQPAVPVQNSLENQTRFMNVFIAFLATLASKNNPLVLFIDDLQWADSNSLTLMEAIVENKESAISHILLLGAYRDNEVNVDHPFVQAVNRIKDKQNTCVRDLNLLPLQQQDVTELIRDSFIGPVYSNDSNDEHNTIRRLGELVYKKTLGNPFFVTQLLTTLLKERHIYINTNNKHDNNSRLLRNWLCDFQAIENMNYTTNVVDLLVNTLRGMPKSVQQNLGTAAAIGPTFDLRLLDRLFNTTVQTNLQHICSTSIYDDLKTAVHENFIVPLDLDAERSLDEEHMNEVTANINNMTGSAVSIALAGAADNVRSSGARYYRFSHDRVQQAAACILSKEDTVHCHFRIAEELLRMFVNPKDFEDNLFAIVNHLNQGIAFATVPFEYSEKKGDSSPYLPITAVSAARLNLMVCEKAKKTHSYALILACANMGIQLLELKGNSCWDNEHYGTLFSLYKFKVEMEYLLGNFQTADEMYPSLLAHAKSKFDKADVYSIMGGQYEVQLRLSDLMKTIDYALKLFDVILPIDADATEQERLFRWELSCVDNLVKPDQIMDLVNIQSSEDKTYLYIMKLLFAIWAPSYIQSMRALAGIISTQMVRRTLTNGLCEESTMGLTSMPFFSGPLTGNYDTSHEFARLGLYLLENRYPHNKFIRGIAYCFYGVGVRHFKMPLRSCTPYLEAAHENSKQAGDMAWASYGAPYILAYMVFQASPLTEVLDAHKRYLPFWKSSPNWIFGAVSYQYALIATELMGEPEPEQAKDFQIGDNPFIDAFYYQSRLLASFFMNDTKDNLVFADKICVIAPEVFIAIYLLPESNTLAALVYLDWLRRFPFHELFDCRVNGSDKGFYGDIELERNLSRAERVKLMKTRVRNINEYTKSLEYLARFCPNNFEHKYILLMAERAHTTMVLGFDIFAEDMDFGDEEMSAVDDEDFSMQRLPSLPTMQTQVNFGSIMELYKQAIDGAHNNKFLQYEAAGLELLGRFWLNSQALHQKRVALVYLFDAIAVYEKWGANAKAKALHDECVLLDSFDNSVQSLKSINNTSIDPQQPQAPILPFLDLEIVVQASQTIATEMDMNTLTMKLMKVIVEHSNAQKGTFFVIDDNWNTNSSNNMYNKSQKDNETLLVTAEYEILDSEFESTTSKNRKKPNIVIYNTPQDCLPLAAWKNGPVSVVNFVVHTRKPLILVSACKDTQFGNDVYISTKQVKSVMCVPILLKNKLKGVMYLENNLYEGLYTKDRVDILSVLTSAMAIALENAQYFHVKIEHQLEKIRFEQLQQDEERQRLRADAAEKYKRQLENFVDMICHEIRNPLNGIFGNAELILHYLNAANALSLRNPPNEAIKTQQLDRLEEYLNQMKVCATSVQTCAEHQKCMTDDVLELSRLRAHKLSLANSYYFPQELIQVVMSMFSVQAATKDLRLEVVNPMPPYDHVRVWGDSIRLSQILTNLVSNAIKFTSSGGVFITVSIVDLSQESLNASNDFGVEGAGSNLVPCYLKVTVRDTGIGMTQEEQSRVFKRFSQANNRMSKEYGGSGLGLAISRKLAKLMKGTITLKSEIGVGSTFLVTVLCAHEDPYSTNNNNDNNNINNKNKKHTKSISTSQVLQANSTIAHLSTQNENVITPTIMTSPTNLKQSRSESFILIVEDNVMNQLLLSRLLQLQGYSVVVTNNGKEGYTKYMAHANTDKSFLAILMDWQMPIMDGLEATIKIREYEEEKKLPAVTIIGLSGNARDDYKHQALNAGMNYYIFNSVN